MLPSPVRCRLGFQGLKLSGPPLVRLRYGLVTRRYPSDSVVGRLQNPGFPTAILLPKLRGSDSYPGGTDFPLNAPAFAGRTTYSFGMTRKTQGLISMTAYSGQCLKSARTGKVGNQARRFCPKLGCGKARHTRITIARLRSDTKRRRVSVSYVSGADIALCAARAHYGVGGELPDVRSRGNFFAA
jgi:hypothetical protein